MIARKKIWLSVDWDFFQEERPEWDWGHAENSRFTDLIWPTRYAMKGITDPDRHEPRASGFWGQLSQHAVYSGCLSEEIGVADSHAAGLPFFHALGKKGDAPEEIWNFDAHHDLGYHSLKELRQWVKEERAEAGSWLYVLLKEYPKLCCRFIHPTWKDPTIEARPWLKDKNIAKRVTVTSARDFFPAESVEVTGIFIAKSGAWSPPWNDLAFANFVENAEHVTGLPYNYSFDRTDPVLQRSFSYKDAEQIVAFFAANNTKVGT